jgi:hypothetical protein
MLNYFLKNVSNIDPFVSNYSFIHAACFGNEIQMLRYLVEEKKFDLNFTNEQINDITPFRWAAKVTQQF